VAQTPEDLLEAAMTAKSPGTRARLARRGLATRASLDRTTHAMLLRQLYLALYELRRFEAALLIAESALALRVIPDVLHHDASRAAVAAGDLESAIVHLRAASRRGPASRRSVHLWTLGSTLFHAGRYVESAAALERAVRWSTHERPLYRAQIALVRIAAGEKPHDLQQVIDDLARSRCGQGYGRFVLGHLAYAARELDAARRHLDAFMRRAKSWSATMVIALEPELAMTRATLTKIGPTCPTV
jgi:tetratricopeptide (TPR) repeat protein